MHVDGFKCKLFEFEYNVACIDTLDVQQQASGVYLASACGGKRGGFGSRLLLWRL